MRSVSSSHRVKGFVKAIKRAEGFGFVTHAATGEDYFFHRSEVKNTTFNELEQDQMVEFEPVEGPKGLRAMDIHVR